MPRQWASNTMRATWTAGPLAVAALLVLVQFQQHLDAKTVRNYDIQFDQAESKFNSEYFGPSSELSIIQKNNMTAIHTTLEIIKAYPNDSVLEFSILEKFDTRYIPSFLKYRRNFCEYLRYETKPPLVDARDHLHFPNSCPVMGLYKLEGYRPDRILPPIMPGPDHWKMVFRITTGGTSGGTAMLDNAIYLHVDRSRAGRGHG